MRRRYLRDAPEKRLEQCRCGARPQSRHSNRELVPHRPRERFAVAADDGFKVAAELLVEGCSSRAPWPSEATSRATGQSARPGEAPPRLRHFARSRLRRRRARVPEATQVVRCFGLRARPDSVRPSAMLMLDPMRRTARASWDGSTVTTKRDDHPSQAPRATEPRGQ